MIATARAFFGLLAFLAIGWQLSIHMHEGFPVLNFFSYFTNLSNLFAAGVLLWTAFDAWSGRASHALVRGLSAVNMAIVGIVFSVLLRDVDLGSLLPWVNFVVHYLMPCVVVIDWLVSPSKLGLRQLGIILIFPLLYLAYVLVRGSGTGWYPYPFLDPANVGGYGGVVLYAIGIALTFLVVGGLLLVVGNRLDRSVWR